MYWYFMLGIVFTVVFQNLALSNEHSDMCMHAFPLNFAYGKRCVQSKPSKGWTAVSGWLALICTLRKIKAHPYVYVGLDMRLQDLGKRALPTLFFFCPPSLCASGGISVLKAQVLAGGRGLGTFDSGLEGGVKVVNS